MLKGFKENIERFSYQKANGHYSVTVGRFNTAQQAKNYALELRKKGFKGAFVIKLPEKYNTLSNVH